MSKLIYVIIILVCAVVISDTFKKYDTSFMDRSLIIFASGMVSLSLNSLHKKEK